MKIFLKKKRLTSQFLKSPDPNSQKKTSKHQKRPQDKHQIYQHQNKQKKNALNSLKTLKFLQNTTQTLNNQNSPISEPICTICEGKISKNILKQKLFYCGHLFCAQCTKSYIDYKISIFQRINCPNQNCKGSLNQQSKFYCGQVPLKQRKLYVKIDKFFEIHQSNGSKRLCSKEQCEGIVEIDKSSATNKCGSCGFQICSKCFVEVHEGECEDYETKFLKQKLNLIKCSKCRNFIEKSQGCNHIVCKCGYEFCEKCKQQWGVRHICKYTGLSGAVEGWGGCDWGITTKDHIKFIVKLPIKLVLIIILTAAWSGFSCLGAPLNLVLIIYWLYLLLVRPSVEKMRSEQSCWKILVYAVGFPFFMAVNIGQGTEYFIQHIDRLLPEVPNSYRSVIRL